MGRSWKQFMLIQMNIIDVSSIQVIEALHTPSIFSLHRVFRTYTAMIDFQRVHLSFKLRGKALTLKAQAHHMQLSPRAYAIDNRAQETATTPGAKSLYCLIACPSGRDHLCPTWTPAPMSRTISSSWWAAART